MKTIWRTALFFIIPALIFAGLLIASDNGNAVKKSRLYGKRVLFCGDSICYGAFDSQQGRAWAGRIGERYSMIADNRAVNGASLSPIRPARIIQQLESVKGEYYDYVILQGGVNDAWGDGYSVSEPGTVSSSYSPNDFDINSFSGAMEELFCYAKECFPEAKIGFIITFATPNAESHGKLTDMEEYYSAAKLICDKWNVSCLDLYRNDYVNLKLLCTNDYTYMYDAVHPNSFGYDRLAPYIADWMNKM